MENKEEKYCNPDLARSVKAVKRNKKISKIYPVVSLVFFGAVMLAVTVIMLFFTRPEMSEIEKRELAKKPVLTAESFFSGEFTDDFSLYFSDTVPFRETLVDLSSRLKKLRGVSSPTFYGNVQIVADDDGSAVETQPITAMPKLTEAQTIIETSVVTDENNQTSIVSQTVTVPPVSTEITTTTEEEISDIAEFSNNGIVVDGVKMYGSDAGIMLFGGNKTQGKRYAEIINQYQQALEGVNVYNMIVPTSAEFYLPKRFSKYSSSQKDSIDYIYSCLNENVTPVDAYSVIKEHTNEYIYFRTDHHWTPRGAYYAYSALAQALGMEAPAISTYQEKVKHGYVGSLYGYTNDITLKNAPEDFFYYLPQNVEYKTTYYNYETLKSMGQGALFHEYVEGGTCYSMFLGMDAIHAKISTNVGNGRRIVVFKESYGNALVPFLVNSFEEIYVIDIRYFGRNAVDYIKEIGATDVLFVNNCFAANTSKLISGIERMFSSPTGTVVTTAPPPETTIIPSEVTNEEGSVYTVVDIAYYVSRPATESSSQPAVTEVPQSALTGAEEQTVVPSGKNNNS